VIELFAYAMLTLVALFALIFAYFTWFWTITFDPIDLEEEDF
jgi:drug/metabolite transporter (DMT)-like permease